MNTNTKPNLVSFPATTSWLYGFALAIFLIFQGDANAQQAPAGNGSMPMEAKAKKPALKDILHEKGYFQIPDELHCKSDTLFYLAGRLDTNTVGSSSIIINTTHTHRQTLQEVCLLIHSNQV